MRAEPPDLSASRDRMPQPAATPSGLMRHFGAIDIYLFDQLLRGRITHGMHVLDTGCGTGRNIRYLMAAGFQVFGIDQDRASIDAVRALAAEAAPQLSAENFRLEPVEAMSFPDEFADFVISCAVLHFARDERHF